MKLLEIAMGHAAIDARASPEGEELGRLAPDESKLMAKSPEWRESQEEQLYVALVTARTCRHRLKDLQRGTDDYGLEMKRRQLALDNAHRACRRLRDADFDLPETLIDMMRTEGVTQWT